MRILLSNDDGVYAEGLAVLAEELARLAEIFIVAPDRNHSGASNSLTLQNPVRLQRLAPNRYSVTGTPTDCVHLAVTGGFDLEFDMVVSGINAGANLGEDVLYSGTVAAATEGGLLGLPALAISLVSEGREQYYQTAAKVAAQIIQKMLISPLPVATILNVNVPDLPESKLRGFELVRLGRRHPAQPAVKTVDPRGIPCYWIGAAGDAEDAGPGTDFYAISEHKVALTPIKIDLTQHSAFSILAPWVATL